jgi:repressor LexA
MHCIKSYMVPLSPDEQKLFDCLRDYLDTHHYSPSLKELQDAIGERSRSKVQTVMEGLRKKGYINRKAGQQRSYQVLVRGVPVLGIIQAGLVIEHPADLVEWIDLPGLSYKSNLYALKIYGDSMIGAHICEGDLVVLRPKPDLWSFRRDAIAAIWVEGEGATLKYVEFNGTHVLLKPANQTYSIRKVKPEQIDIQGIVLSVHRYYER